ncbi:MAG: HMA2 domain-containing protein [Prochloraceae cyanobacterium]
MTATSSTNNFTNLSAEDAASQLGSFLREHGEIEMILPVAIGVFITSQFKLRGANALLVNLLVASLARQIFTQLKQEKPSALTESNNSSSAVQEIGASETNLQGYTIAHAVPGRVRLQMPQLATDADFARRLQQALKLDEHVNHVRINRAAASLAINYNTQGLSDWELGMRLMNIVNTVRQEHQIPQAVSN